MHLGGCGDDTCRAFAMGGIIDDKQRKGQGEMGAVVRTAESRKQMFRAWCMELTKNG